VIGVVLLCETVLVGLWREEGKTLMGSDVIGDERKGGRQTIKRFCETFVLEKTLHLVPDHDLN
jgi:hypothetical protein